MKRVVTLTAYDAASSGADELSACSIFRQLSVFVVSAPEKRSHLVQLEELDGDVRAVKDDASSSQSEQAFPDRASITQYGRGYRFEERTHP